MDEQQFMQLAIQKTKEGLAKGQTPFGATIVKDGKVVVVAHNTVWKTTDITAHGEVTAIRKACKKLKTIDLSGCVIYSTCEPCPMCFSAIHWSNISKIVYGARIADAHNVGFHELAISNKDMKTMGGSPIEIVSDFMREECIELFTIFQKRKGKKLY
jgi:tRNA(Arg) A34 adenosine deaminase TadA